VWSKLRNPALNQDHTVPALLVKVGAISKNMFGMATGRRRNKRSPREEWRILFTLQE